MVNEAEHFLWNKDLFGFKNIYKLISNWKPYCRKNSTLPDSITQQLTLGSDERAAESSFQIPLTTWTGFVPVDCSLWPLNRVSIEIVEGKKVSENTKEPRWWLLNQLRSRAIEHCIDRGTHRLSSSRYSTEPRIDVNDFHHNSPHTHKL